MSSTHPSQPEMVQVNRLTSSLQAVRTTDQEPLLPAPPAAVILASRQHPSTLPISGPKSLQRSKPQDQDLPKLPPALASSLVQTQPTSRLTYSRAVQGALSANKAGYGTDRELPKPLPKMHVGDPIELLDDDYQMVDAADVQRHQQQQNNLRGASVETQASTNGFEDDKEIEESQEVADALLASQQATSAGLLHAKRGRNESLVAFVEVPTIRRRHSEDRRQEDETVGDEEEAMLAEAKKQSLAVDAGAQRERSRDRRGDRERRDEQAATEEQEVREAPQGAIQRIAAAVVGGQPKPRQHQKHPRMPYDELYAKAVDFNNERAYWKGECKGAHHQYQIVKDKLEEAERRERELNRALTRADTQLQETTKELHESRAFVEGTDAGDVKAVIDGIKTINTAVDDFAFEFMDALGKHIDIDKPVSAEILPSAMALSNPKYLQLACEMVAKTERAQANTKGKNVSNDDDEDDEVYISSFLEAVLKSEILKALYTQVFTVFKPAQDEKQGETFSELYETMRQKQTQPFCGRWRSLTYTFFQSSGLNEKDWVLVYATGTLGAFMSRVDAMAGKEIDFQFEPFVDALGKIIASSIDWKHKTSMKHFSHDYNVQLSPPPRVIQQLRVAKAEAAAKRAKKATKALIPWGASKPPKENDYDLVAYTALGLTQETSVKKEGGAEGDVVIRRVSLLDAEVILSAEKLEGR